MWRLALLSLAAVAAIAQTDVRMDGATYEVLIKGAAAPVVTARIGAQIDGQWIYSTDYPKHDTMLQQKGGRSKRMAIHSGLAGKPDLVATMYPAGVFAELSAGVVNHTPKSVKVQAIRILDATGARPIDLGGPDSDHRVYSDSYSENRPVIRIFDFGRAPGGMHRGSWAQLVYNRKSRRSLFVGALTAERLVTMIHLNVKTFTVDSTGTAEVQKSSTLRASPPSDQIELSLPVAPGQTLTAEPVMIMAGSDYHVQLETYGRTVRDRLHARVDGPSPMGFWSWTGLYSAISEGTLRANAQFLAQHLKPLGYEFFHIDEGYMFARGEYTTPDAARFPNGIVGLAHEIGRLGLKLGIWTAPFEVSMRSSVYEQHKDWLVHNAAGEPIQLGREITQFDKLFALDTTHPGAQEYLRQTYRILTREWGVRYIKMDFMDDTTVEGYYHKPDTTALEAQRIGLGIIRETVGEDVILDKDGSPMLSAVGYVDTGRISVDTSHEFDRIRRANPGIAARYYMHRNFFINDPDAFCVSRQLIGEVKPYTQFVTLSEAEVSIALMAVSGGMWEIGDDLPSLAADKDRLALAKNPDLLRMAKLSRASRPLDLMSYEPEDEEPSIFFLNEDRRHATLTVFNWTGKPRSHKFNFADLGLKSGQTAYDVMDRNRPVQLSGGAIVLENQPPHSVRMIRLTDPSVGAAAPELIVEGRPAATAGEDLTFTASADPNGVPAISYVWNFGDGVSMEGAKVTHTYTLAGDFSVEVTAEGVDGIPAKKTLQVQVNGTLKTPFQLRNSRRYVKP
jgi:alpha-galactosidase